MHKGSRIALIPQNERRLALASFGVIAVLFAAATFHTQYQPFEFLISMENFWLFIFQDLLPPKIADWGTILEGLVQTVSMAVSASLIAAILSLVLAFLGANTTSPMETPEKVDPPAGLTWTQYPQHDLDLPFDHGLWYRYCGRRAGAAYHHLRLSDPLLYRNH